MARKPKYKARAGWPISDENAQLVGEQIDSMNADGVLVTPDSLLGMASKPDSPIHHLFEWDDRKAAHRQRQERARFLSRCYTVIDIRTKKPCPATYSVNVSTLSGSDEDAGRAYVSRKVVLSNERAQMEVGSRLYERAMQCIEEAESLGLHDKWPNWKRICRTVRQNEPPSVVDVPVGA